MALYAARCGKPLVANVTGIWSLSCVAAHVNLEGVESTKFHPADLTGKRPIVGVCTHVECQQSLLYEFLAAIGTLIQPLSAVNMFVIVQCTRLCEPLLTHITLVRSFTSVRSHVLCQAV